MIPEMLTEEICTIHFNFPFVIIGCRLYLKFYSLHISFQQMGLGESKDQKTKLKLFPEEERIQLENNFEKLSKGCKNKVDRQTLEVYKKFLING